jgi:uncharacterized protein YdeI (YjbR/CyaY-like superfamily)
MQPIAGICPYNALLKNWELNTMATQNLNSKVHAYIAKARPFAQPIMTHFRGLVHKSCPKVEETIKWSRPFFEYRGVILCFMAAFKEHCSFGFWDPNIRAELRQENIQHNAGMGSLGRITRVEDLPPDKQILGWIRKGAGLVDNGNYTSPIAARRKEVKARKPAVKMSPEFRAGLQKNAKAEAVFAAFSPSAKREYVEWIAEAKRPETRDKRIATAIGWIAEGKQRNWKYQNC